MNDNNLKSCPFCGGENVYIDSSEDGDDTMYYVFCPDCGFESGLYSKAKIIQEKWNRRSDSINH